MELTQELVKKLYIYKEGFLYWIVNKGCRGRIGNKASCFNSAQNRYTIRLNNKTYLNSRIIFLWHYGYLPEMVDHINHDCTNDKIENLRAATRSENRKNSKRSKNGSSQYLGVCFRYKDFWTARIMYDNKNRYIGGFKTESEAALAYNREAVKNHKEFANLNIIKP